MKQEIVDKILKQTEQGYDLISGKFSQTRKHFWGNLEFIKDYTKRGDKVLDYGCGNGRLLELFVGRKVDYIGVDVSKKMLDIACEKHTNTGNSREKISFQKISPSQISLPFKENYFNTVYAVAVFHHLPSQKLRLEIAKELYRNLKPNGHIVITVWNLWQKRYRKNIFKNWNNKLKKNLFLRIKSGEFLGDLDWNDCWINFTDNEGKKFKRFHHAFTKQGLKELFEQVGFKIEKCEIINDWNIVLIGKKPTFKPQTQNL